MATWVATITMTVHAETRKDAWEKAQDVAQALEGAVVSIPQQPEKL